jgi:hypothetical protein
MLSILKCAYPGPVVRSLDSPRDCDRAAALFPPTIPPLVRLCAATILGGTEEGGKTRAGCSGVNDRMGREARRNWLRRKIPAKEVRGTYGGRTWRSVGGSYRLCGHTRQERLEPSKSGHLWGVTVAHMARCRRLPPVWCGTVTRTLPARPPRLPTRFPRLRFVDI